MEVSMQRSVVHHLNHKSAKLCLSWTCAGLLAFTRIILLHMLKLLVKFDT